jgi:hypothetical protein
MSAALNGKRVAALALVGDKKVYFWRSGAHTVSYDLIGGNNALHQGTMRWLHDSGYFVISTTEKHGIAYVTPKGANALAEHSVPA